MGTYAVWCFLLNLHFFDFPPSCYYTSLNFCNILNLISLPAALSQFSPFLTCLCTFSGPFIAWHGDLSLLCSPLQLKTSLQCLLDQAANQKTNIEVVGERCEVLMDFSGHSPVRDRTVKLQGEYSNAVSQLQVRKTI